MRPKIISLVKEGYRCTSTPHSMKYLVKASLKKIPHCSRGNSYILDSNEPPRLLLSKSLRLPQVFYNQGLSSLRRSVSYVQAEH